MTHTGSFLDLDHPLGTAGLLLLLVVARLAGPAYSPPTTPSGRVGQFAARRALDAVSVVGWLFDRLPQRAIAPLRAEESAHRAAAARRTAATIWM
jgi:hypothetical protein